MKIVCSRQTQLGRTNEQTDERTLAFLELLSEPKNKTKYLGAECLSLKNKLRMFLCFYVDATIQIRKQYEGCVDAMFTRIWHLDLMIRRRGEAC